MGVSTLSLLEEGETSRLTTNSILSASLRLCWNSSPSWWFIIITKCHRVIHPSCVVTVHQLHCFFSSEAASSIYHYTVVLPQCSNIYPSITDVPIRPTLSTHLFFDRIIPIMKWSRSSSLSPSFLSRFFFSLEERQSSPFSSKQQSCTRIRPPCFLPRHHYFLPAIALHNHNIHSST